MPIYHLVDDLRMTPGSQWVIERTAVGQSTIRLVFNGSRKEAMTETTRLNTLAGIPPNFRPPAIRRPITLKAAKGE